MKLENKLKKYLLNTRKIKILMLPQKVFFSDVKFLVQFPEIPVMCINTKMYLPTWVIHQGKYIVLNN